MPHGHCYLWKPALVGLQVVSNLLIGLAYVAITVTLVYLVRRIRNIPFQWMYLAFSVFIVTCGMTHFFDVWVIWTPSYWLDGSLRAVTAVASVGTALMLPPLVPKAVAIAEAAALSHERGMELEKSNRDLGLLLDRTKELEQLKTQFFANVSHELRTPLALILGPAEKLLASEALDPGQRHDVEVMARNARTLLKHVNDLLDVSKLEAGKLHPDYVEVDFAETVRVVAANFDGLARERLITYTVDAAGPLIAAVDAPKMERVLLNLLSNAFKVTPQGGRIRCSLSFGAPATPDGPRRLQMEVGDSGPGISPPDRLVVFERFRQLDSASKRPNDGTGLGLSIAKDFVELHGGAISVDSAPEGGALFRVSLPASPPAGAVTAPRRRAIPVLGNGADGDAAADAAAGATAVRSLVDDFAARSDPRTDGGEEGRATILLAEDNREMARFIQGVLASRYRVIVTHDGQAALAQALAAPPDLVLTDVMMPGMSGDELVRALRAQGTLEDVPIVLLTAKADDELRVRLLNEGAQDYLMKPFSGAELHARIANLVTVKRAREVLQRELDSHVRDLNTLASQMGVRNRELQTTLASLRVARDTATKASHMKTTFLGLVSHELRTPLTALHLQLHRLRNDREEPLSERHTALAKRMSVAAGRLTDLVESLLNYAHMESGKLTLELEEFDVTTLVHQVVEELSEQAQAKALPIDTDLASDLGRSRSDSRLVRLVLVNLLGNAVKFTNSGRVVVAGRRAGTACEITVRDTGPGISTRDQQRIFEPFSQGGDLATKHLPGVGLGLTLVKEMVDSLGGHLHLQSEVGVGTTFTVTWPSL